MPSQKSNPNYSPPTIAQMFEAVERARRFNRFPSDAQKIQDAALEALPTPESELLGDYIEVGLRNAITDADRHGFDVRAIVAEELAKCHRRSRA